jgi:hypothetical protein
MKETIMANTPTPTPNPFETAVAIEIENLRTSLANLATVATSVLARIQREASARRFKDANRQADLARLEMSLSELLTALPVAA